jgi:hypothetical protein
LSLNAWYLVTKRAILVRAWFSWMDNGPLLWHQKTRHAGLDGGRAGV